MMMLLNEASADYHLHCLRSVSGRLHPVLMTMMYYLMGLHCFDSSSWHGEELATASMEAAGKTTYLIIAAAL